MGLWLEVTEGIVSILLKSGIYGLLYMAFQLTFVIKKADINYLKDQLLKKKVQNTEHNG